VTAKTRLDLLVVERSLASTQSQARALIMAGLVLVDKARIDKPGTLVSANSLVELKGEPSPYVSRGGQKLAKALDKFSLDLEDRIVLDVGASTGGFTDCCLQAGARLVYAVDVGYGQLAWSLRTNPQVINMERTNIRHLTKERLAQGMPDFCSIDVAFISLNLVLPVIAQLGIRELVMLIKPQFEAGREQVGKNGVVRDPETHLRVINQVVATAEKLGFTLWNLDFSPVQGPKGNIEYLAHGFFDERVPDLVPTSQQVVAAAHEYFK
jgi:23S rRNA (cytidine1920-2'-O)/16S rRNA (cytidine1409-2'-O)-methyltransferase